MPGAGWSRMFAGRIEEVEVARDFAAAVLIAWGFPDKAIDVGRLIVTELATNAVQHTASGGRWGQFTVSLFPIDGTACVRVAVADEGGPATPRRTAGSDDQEHGFGLLSVSEIALDWGVSGNERGRTVWADIDEDSRLMGWDHLLDGFGVRHGRR